MAMFDDSEKPISNLEPYAMAIRLKEIVQIKLRHAAPVRAANWSEDIRKLIRETGGEATRVERVLDWYDTYCERGDGIRCLNAASFRKMFYALEGLCNKDARQRIELCPASIAIAARLREVTRWHGGSDKRLDSAVKRSLDAYIAFKKKLICQSNEELDRFLQWITPELIRDPEDFVYGWFVAAHRRVRSWLTWNGDLEPLLFSEESERLANWGSDMAAAYGDRRLWPRLFDSINKGA